MRFGVQFLVLATALPLAFSATAAEPAARPAERSRKASGRASKLPEAELTDEAQLARVVGLYEAGKYGECASAVSALFPPQAKRPLRDRDVIESARLYQAACFIGSGKSEQADEPLRAAIRANVQMKPPDSLVFPPPVVERFLRVRQSLYDEIRSAEQAKVDEARQKAAARAEFERAEFERVTELERLASIETVTIKNRRWIALVPFGVGQFQNGNDGLGWVFLTSEVVLAATSLTALAAQSYFTLEASRPENLNTENNAVLRTWHTLLRVSTYSLLGVTAVGIAEAQLSFVPEFRQERARKLPERLRRREAGLRILPVAEVTAERVSVSVIGTF